MVSLGRIFLIVVVTMNVSGGDATFFGSNKGTATGSEEDAEEGGVLERIKNSLQVAGKLLRLDAASGIAQLVSDTFGDSNRYNDRRRQKKGDDDDNEKKQGLFSGFFRLLGFDTSKLAAIAVNGIIFLAQLISKSLKSKSNPQLVQNANNARNFANGSPLEWVLSHSNVTELLSQAKDKELPEHVVRHLQERTTDEDSACVQLMICKLAPFLWGMQRALDVGERTAADKRSGATVMFDNLPTTDEVLEHGDECEKKHPYCVLF